ncbi:PH domain-containing protein [Microbacterium sp. nov. GSS16]|uniref:PH domain-containing protein n=1 Tax=Microbacterium sp. nov. GSS16 TaxID=3019890 RepID=UPI002306D23B|nr:PH domain-containing protein [Microbacterium sp. nov. GSS16]WCD92600.1 PH domain-containing protein [Microbacterium sp. nov. GSS16]
MAPAGAASLRSRGGVALLVICSIVSAVLLIDAAVRADAVTAALLAPWPLLVLWAVYVLGVASRVRATRDGVLVQNLLRTVFVPWARVQQIRMRWQIEITLDDGSLVTCFGGPARRRPQRLGPGRTKEDANGRADDAVAALRKAKASAVNVTPVPPVRRGWDFPAIIALLVLIAWAVTAVLVTRA